MVNITINGRALQVEDGVKIIEAADKAGFPIPRLCYWKDLNEIGACRVCVVEVEGLDRLVPACDAVVEEGMSIRTDSPRVLAARRINTQLILSQHNTSCTTCVRNGNCQLQKLAIDLNLHSQPFPLKLERNRVEAGSPLIREADKCVKCMRCVQVCDNVQSVDVWKVVNTGSRVTIGVNGGSKLSEICAFCGQCVTHCPVGALTERDDTEKVLAMLADPEITTIVQVAPAVRVAWAEAFGFDTKFATPARLAAALRRIGFDFVFDTNFGADLTIMEEGSEFVERVKTGGKFPMFTSCCPGWVRFVKKYYPEFVDNLSSAKSPQQMFGAVAKSYFAEQKGIDPKKIRVVSIMPCLAKKAECKIPTLNDACGDPDVDVVLTTREATRLLRAKCVAVADLPEEEFDSPLGSGTGAAVVFGATGGVMDAALRSVYYLVVGKNPDADAFRSVRGIRPWKEAVFNVPGVGDVRVAVVSGLGNTRKLLEALKKGEVQYEFVEVMACPGGCAGGGGQPICDGKECAEYRGDALWDLDAGMKIRFSHENADVQALYADYLEKPLGRLAHRLLHTDHQSWEITDVTK